jgi:hypothetical protein
LPDLTLIAQHEYADENKKQQLNNLDLPSSTKQSRPIHQSKSTIISKDLESLASSDQKRRKNKHSESESEDEAKQKPEKVSTPRSVADIADGALSDSEVDRQRYDNVSTWLIIGLIFQF